MPRREHISSGRGRHEAASVAGIVGDPFALPVMKFKPGGGLVPAPDARVFSRDRVRELDRLAVDEFRMPSIVLMENAALGAAWACVELLRSCRGGGDEPGGPDGRSALILCGKGNNAGDGFALARRLHNWGWKAALLLAAAPDQYVGDARVNLDICLAMGVPHVAADAAGPKTAVEAASRVIGSPSLVVDGLLGTGLSGPVRGVLFDMIAMANTLRSTGVPVLALDIPSGLDADTGEPTTPEGPGTEGAPAAVVADMTVTFAGPKRGFMKLGAQRFLGRVVVAEIGVPVELVNRLSEPVAERAPGHADEPETGGVSPPNRFVRRG